MWKITVLLFVFQTTFFGYASAQCFFDGWQLCSRTGNCSCKDIGLGNPCGLVDLLDDETTKIQRESVDIASAICSEGGVD